MERAESQAEEVIWVRRVGEMGCEGRLVGLWDAVFG